MLVFAFEFISNLEYQLKKEKHYLNELPMQGGNHNYKWYILYLHDKIVRQREKIKKIRYIHSSTEQYL